MVLSAPPAHAAPAQSHWLDKLVVAIELSAHHVLTLVNGAVRARLHEAYLRLRACDPATDVIIDVRRLATLPPSTVILALDSTITDDDLDWLNLNRPILSDRQLCVVLWCEDSMAAVLAQRAPDLFDWISASVDCPPAPVAHAVADVRAAILARARGIAWDGPGLEDTLAALRPGRPVHRVAVASYQSMLDALTSREPGWLLLEGIDTEFHLRRLRWAMAEARRRVIVIRSVGPELNRTLPGWWAANATQVPIAKAVHELTGVGGSGRLAALTGLDPGAYMYARFALRQGKIAAEHLEAQLASATDPRSALRDLVRQQGWTAEEVIREHDPQRPIATERALKNEAARHERDDDPIVSALGEQPLELRRWAELGTKALKLEDFEVAIRWLTAASRLLASDDDPGADPLLAATVLTRRGRAHRLAGDLSAARGVLERAHDNARRAGDATLIATSATELGFVLLDQGEPQRASAHLESALHASEQLGEQEDVATLLDTLGRALAAQGKLSQAGRCLDRALSIKRAALGTEDHPAYATSLSLLGIVLAAQGDMTGARRDLERSLEISERWLRAEHPSVGAILLALAHVHRDAGDLPKARQLLDRALAIQRATLGPDHPAIADTLVTRANVLATSGNLEEARATLENALAIQRKVFGNDGQLAGAATRQELAKVLVAAGDLTGALDNLRQALITLRRIHGGDDHPGIALVLREVDHLHRLQSNLQRS